MTGEKFDDASDPTKASRTAKGCIYRLLLLFCTRDGDGGPLSGTPATRKIARAYVAQLALLFCPLYGRNALEHFLDRRNNTQEDLMAIWNELLLCGKRLLFALVRIHCSK